MLVGVNFLRILIMCWYSSVLLKVDYRQVDRNDVRVIFRTLGLQAPNTLKLRVLLINWTWLWLPLVTEANFHGVANIHSKTACRLQQQMFLTHTNCTAVQRKFVVLRYSQAIKGLFQSLNNILSSRTQARALAFSG